MKIYTLTLNPAFDLHYTIDDFKPYGENYVCKSLLFLFAGILKYNGEYKVMNKE